MPACSSISLDTNTFISHFSTHGYRPGRLVRSSIFPRRRFQPQQHQHRQLPLPPTRARGSPNSDQQRSRRPTRYPELRIPIPNHAERHANVPSWHATSRLRPARAIVPSIKSTHDNVVIAPFLKLIRIQVGVRREGSHRVQRPSDTRIQRCLG